MKLIRNTPWPRVLAEGVIIVVSILLAFWIDTWWEDRQLRSEEAVLLEGVLVELQDLETIFDENTVYIDAIRQSIRSLLEATAAADANLTNEEIDLLLADTFWIVPPSSVQTPTLDSVFYGGGQTTISDSTLRLEMGLLAIQLRSLRRVVQRDYDYEDLPSFYSKHTSFLKIWNLQTPMPGFPEVIDDFEPIPLGTDVSHREILESREFQNLLVTRDQLLRQIVSAQGDIKPKLDSTVALLKDKLGH